jgi:hypothetical protein
MTRHEREAGDGVLLHRAHGYCNSCYTRWWRTGDPRPPIKSLDVDQIAVERAILGDPPARLNPFERLEVVAVLTRRGLSARQIAEHARCTTRTVTRNRTKLAGRAA